jgi:microcystin-dependent protein
MSNFVNLLDIVYPVGSIYQSMDATSPADFIGGTWTQIKTFLYGADTANQTGGEATHTLTIDEMPNHHHRLWVSTWASAFGGSSVTCSNSSSNYLSANDNQGNFTGGGAAHNNLPPYTTCFIWYRTA